MKKSALILFFLCLLGVTGLCAQSLDGRYVHAENLNQDDIEVTQIVLQKQNGNIYQGSWTTALATGENEVVTALQNLVVDPQNLKISFSRNGQSHNGQFISDGGDGYDLVLDGQTLFSRNDW